MQLTAPSDVTTGLRCGAGVEAARFARLVRTMVLDHDEWDAQVGDPQLRFGTDLTHHGG